MPLRGEGRGQRRDQRLGTAKGPAAGDSGHRGQRHRHPPRPPCPSGWLPPKRPAPRLAPPGKRGSKRNQPGGLCRAPPAPCPVPILSQEGSSGGSPREMGARGETCAPERLRIHSETPHGAGGGCIKGRFLGDATGALHRSPRPAPLRQGASRAAAARGAARPQQPLLSLFRRVFRGNASFS